MVSDSKGSIEGAKNSGSSSPFHEPDKLERNGDISSWFIPGESPAERQERDHKQAYDAYQKMINDVYGPEAPHGSRSKYPLLNLDKRYSSRVDRIERAQRSFEENFPKLDIDHDGFVSKKELERASDDPSLDASAQDMLKILNQGFSTIAGLETNNPAFDAGLLASGKLLPSYADEVSSKGISIAAMKELGIEFSYTKASSAAFWRGLEVAGTFGAIAGGSAAAMGVPLPAAAALGGGIALFSYGSEHQTRELTYDLNRAAVWNILNDVDEEEPAEVKRVPQAPASDDQEPTYWKLFKDPGQISHFRMEAPAKPSDSTDEAAIRNKVELHP